MKSFITPMLPAIAPSPMKKKKGTAGCGPTLSGALGLKGVAGYHPFRKCRPRGLYLVNRRAQPKAGEPRDQRFSAAGRYVPLFAASDQRLTSANYCRIKPPWNAFP